jgi:hypothetical protein
MRFRSALTGAAGLAAAATVLAAPVQAAPPSCAHLHGKKVLTTPQLRVVSVRMDRVYRKDGMHVVGRKFLACAKPNGKTHTVGTIYGEYATTGPVKGHDAVDSGLTSFGQSAGTFLLTRTRAADLSGNYQERTYRVVDVATGRRYTYFHLLEGEETSSEPAPPVIARLDATGRLAAIISQPQDSGYSAPPVGQAQVVVFSNTGERTVLDTAPVGAIPPSSLALTDGVVGWTNAGQAKSAPAPGSPPRSS